MIQLSFLGAMATVGASGVLVGAFAATPRRLRVRQRADIGAFGVATQ